MHWTRRLAALCLLWLVTTVALAQQLAPIPPLDSPVVDTTGTLDAATQSQLVQQAQALQQRKGSQLQVLVVPTTEPEDIAQYTQRVYDQWKLGRQGVDDGVILVVAKDDRRVRIQPGYGLEGAIPDATSSRIIQEYLVPKFRAGDFAGGITDASAQLVRLIDGEPLPEPVADHAPGRDRGGNWLFALIAAFIVANVIRGIFNGTPAGIRGLLAGAGAGGVAWLISSALLVGGIGAFIGLFLGLAGAGAGRFARDDSWGGWGGGGMGGWGGGSSGGSWGGGGGFGGGGGGWSGGGGMSGGGGASGSW